MNFFQKYGGADFWSKFLNGFYTKITSSEQLSKHFVDKDIDYIKSMLIGLLEVTLVTEGHYPEDSLKEGHKNMGISMEDFEAWISIYTSALTDSGVNDEDTNIIISLIQSYRHCIVTIP
jgi:truncated hemoglobin YjbI